MRIISINYPLLILFLLISCTYNEAETEEKQYDLELIRNSVEDVQIKPVNELNLDGDYQLLISLNKDLMEEELPSAFKVCLLEGEVIQKSSRNIYSLTTKNIRLREMYKKEQHQKKLSEPHLKALPGVEFGCEISFSRPGEKDENCNDEECSETSMLGGETLFCVCIYDCSFKITSK